MKNKVDVQKANAAKAKIVINSVKLMVFLGSLNNSIGRIPIILYEMCIFK